MQRFGGGERKAELEMLAERSAVIDHHDTAMGIFAGDAQSVPNGRVRCAAVNFFGS
jgi:hypothetical protein